MRVGFATCLFVSQLISQRESPYSQSPLLVAAGAVLFLAGLGLLYSASIELRRAVQADALAVAGPFRYVRHPIYTSVYLITSGIGLVFFAWAWFVVMLAFAPLWYRESVAEERDLADRFGAQYLDFRARTRMFVPGVF